MVERPCTVTVQSENNVLVGRVVHMRAMVEAGTELRYWWDFGDGTAQFDSRNVSHVYGAAGTYNVTVTVSNGMFDEPATGHTSRCKVGWPPPARAPRSRRCRKTESPTHCRIRTDGEVRARPAHAEQTRREGRVQAGRPHVQAREPRLLPRRPDVEVADTTLCGPDYSELSFSITAGNPVYAFTPMRGLLDIQPCEETQAADDRRGPRLLEGLEGDAVGAGRGQHERADTTTRCSRAST